MADYQPIYVNGVAPFTATVSAAVIGGRLVAVSGVGTVAHASADDATVAGVAAFDQATVGGRVTVWPIEGVVHELEASGAIAVDAGVVSDANGQVKTATIATAAAAGTLIGTAGTTATGSPLKLRVFGRR